MLSRIFLILLLSIVAEISSVKYFDKMDSKALKFGPFRRPLASPSNFLNTLPSNGEQSLCTEATVTFSMDEFVSFEDSWTNLTATLNLKLFNENGNDYLLINNVSGCYTNRNQSISDICYITTNTLQCNMDPINPYTFTLDKSDPSVRIEGQYGGTSTDIYEGYANNGTLSNNDGTLFNSNNPCNIFNQTYSYSNYVTFYQKICCTKMIPAPEIPPNFPRCKRFRSRTILYNNDYSIHATSSMNYTLNGYQVTTQGDFNAPSDDAPSVIYYFQINNKCDSQNTSTLSCVIDLPPTDGKTFISMAFVMGNVAVGPPQVGIFFIRNNQTLAYEGIPFSTKNDCIYYTHTPKTNDPYDKPSSTEFCCKEFE